METNEVLRNRQRACNGSLFKPREFKGGRVSVSGCSPGCRAVSIGLSLLLTLAVNGCIRLF